MLVYSRNFLSFNPLATNDDYSCHQNSATCYQLAQSVLKIGSLLAENGGTKGGGWVSPGGCMVAVVAGCRKALVNARWPIILLSCTNGPRKHFFRLVGAPCLTF